MSHHHDYQHSDPVIVDNSMARVCFHAENRTVVVSLRRWDAPRPEFEDLKRRFKAMYDALFAMERADDRRVVMRFDLRADGWMNYEYVKEWAALFRQSTHITNAVVERSEVVVGNSLVRGALSAFLSLYPTQRPVDILSE